MADKLPDNVQKKIKNGWIRAWMMIEVVAITPEAAKEALEKHVDKLEKEKKSMIYKKKYHKSDKIKANFANATEAYSLVVEIEMISQDFDHLFFIVLNYAPSSIEILEPEKYVMDAGEAQGILNSLSDILHRFAASRDGGIVIKG